MDARRRRLGVDFGTSNTVAMLAWPDGQVRPLLFDGSPTLPSAVFADAQSGLLVGRDAMHAARISPERYEPNPKRRIDEAVVLLGDWEVATVDLVAAVLARVAGEARRVTGGALGPTTVTCPAAWAQTRRGVLLAAAERAGLGAVTLVPEPVAAAQVFRMLGGAGAPVGLPGSAFVVYDLGAGTFDASVVRHGGGAFEVLAAEGLSTSGGLDIDAAIVGYLGATHAGRDPGAWQRLTHPSSSAERRANRLLWDDVRSAKEMLSRTSSTMIHIPALETDVPLGRDQFEQLARPILAATVTATRAAVAAARLSAADVEGVFLVGGGSRIPLVATLLHQALGKAPTVVEQPELVVAQGAVGASAQFTAPGAGSAGAGHAAGGAIWGPPVSGAGGSGVVPGAVSGAPASPAVSGPPASGVSGPPDVSSVSGPPGTSMSRMPGGGGSASMPSAPVSPAFSSAPVTGYPVSPAVGGYTAPTSGAPGGPGVPGPPVGRVAGPAPAGVAASGGGAAGGGAVPPVAARAAAGAPSGGTAGERGRRTGVLVAVAVAVLLVIGASAYGVSQLVGKKGNDVPGDNSSSQDSSYVSAEIDHPNVDWASKAEEYDGKAGTTIAYECPSHGTIGTVWGSGPYTTDSAVCTAAVHDGRISLEDGGRVVIKILQGQSSYEGSTQNGIMTTAYDAYPWAFQIIS
ncbi:Hsp70 family protein [Dactylosporangium sp. NPDC000555]|uniref:Hsp70 family protein n=1 Tax=Dactylosporangium sp. NPDC000555 TaxID=3154260 RepID=UPI00332BAA70